MDSKKAAALLKKYWENETSIEEEKELKNQFLLQENSNDLGSMYFNYLNKKGNQLLPDDEFESNILEQISADKQIKKHKSNRIKYWYAAASLVLLISASIIFKNEIIKEKQPILIAETDTYEDPQLAFEETKRALLLISSKLNGPTEYASEFSKFEKSQNTLKEN